MKRRSAVALTRSPAWTWLLASAFAIALLLALTHPAAAAKRSPHDLCNDEDWAHMNFGEKGVTVRDIQEMHEAAPSGMWHIDTGENGSVQLTDWDRNEIHICARITAWAKDRQRAERLLHSIHVENDGGRLHAEGPEQTNASHWGVYFKIYAPRNTDLDVQALNGAISVEGIRGRMTLHTQNGPLRIEDAGGDIEARTTNGPLQVTLTGSRWQGRGLDAETTNGPVQLSIPNGYSAELTTGTNNGPVAGAFVGSGRHHRPGRRHIKAVLGSGGAPIRVVTSNGPIVVNQGGHHGDDDSDDDE